MTKKRKKKIPRYIGMSYKERQDHYEQEKNELFYKIASMPATEVAKAHEALIKKWGI